MITPVIYDEISNFKDATSYPFEKRKNTLISSKNDEPKFDAEGSFYVDGEVRKIYLNTAKVCFDRKWYSDILFWNDDEPCEENDD